MINSGFLNSDNRKVYEKNGVYFYEFGHEDGFNGCAPFFDGFKHEPPMVEGPSLMGLALAAEELRGKNSSSSVAKALIPIEEKQRPDQNAFGSNYNREYVALTDFGSIIIDYNNHGANKGMVIISVRNREGVQEYGRQYDIVFA